MIREFKPQDLNGIIRLGRYHARETGVQDALPFDDVYATKNLRQLFVDPNVKCLVVEKNDEIIGYAIFMLHTKLWNPTLFGELYFFYIIDGERNKMVADMLWSEMIAVCKKHGAQFFESDVTAWTKDYIGSKDAVDRVSTYYEHKRGEHCGNHYVHRIEY